jgi:DNA-directed RNA polymerase subunit RPC12/RpoP
MEVRCPQCDAVVEVGTEQTVLKCRYCGTQLYYEKDKVFTKESIKTVLDSRVAGKLLKNRTGKDLKVELEYFPFYRIKTEKRTIFLPGKVTDLIGIDHYVPQGDRIPLEIDVSQPELNLDEALAKIGVEKAEAIGLVYLPFFTSKDGDTLYCLDAVKGNILSNSLEQQGEHSKNQHPFALFSFGVVMLAALFFPVLPFKLISVILITLAFWYYDRGRQNA